MLYVRCEVRSEKRNIFYHISKFSRVLGIINVARNFVPNFDHTRNIHQLFTFTRIFAGGFKTSLFETITIVSHKKDVNKKLVKKKMKIKNGPNVLIL